MSPSTNLKIKISSTGSHKSWKQIGSRQPFKCGDEIAKFQFVTLLTSEPRGFVTIQEYLMIPIDLLYGIPRSFDGLDKENLAHFAGQNFCHVRKISVCPAVSYVFVLCVGVTEYRECLYEAK